jgi:uncharacterized protein
MLLRMERSTRSRLLAIAWGAGVLLVAGFLAAGWVGSERALHPAAAHYTWSLSTYPGLHPEEVSFPSRTGILLRGSFFPGPRRATIILSHGYGDNRDLMLPFAGFLHRAGFSVLTYDMRASGTSGGRDVTLGAFEHQDLVSAVDYLSTRKDVDPARIGALGISLGGSVTLLAAAEDPRIRAAVDDSGFSSPESEVAAGFEHFIHLPAFPFAPLAIAIAEWRAGVNLRDVRAIDQVASIAPRPLLVIHCTADTTVPPAHSEQIFARARNPKELWLVPGCSHAQAHTAAQEEYERRVTHFFETALQ